ncbi:MAG: Bug family tripartite tricarboxylate transporter substrate binding protein [Lautropia sp.]
MQTPTAVPMPNPTRRDALATIAATLALAVASRVEAQQAAWPTQTIRILVPFAAGGGGDTLARVLAPKLSEIFKQPVVVENRPGASGIIATDTVIKSPPDGHTLLVHAMPMVITPATFANPPYDPVRDLTTVAELISSPLWFVVSTARTQARTLKEFVEQVKAEPGKHQYAGVSPGSTGHLYGFKLAEAAKLDLPHIGYKGSAPVTLAILNGEITAAFLDMVTLKPHLAGGKLRLLAVTGPKRSAHSGDVPTFLEQGFPGFESNTWGGLFGPRGMPAAVVQQLAATVTALLKDPAVGGRYEGLGYDVGTMTQAQFAAQVAADRDMWAALVKKAGVKSE